MTWIESGGGPLVILEHRLRGSWTGIGEGPWEPGSGTDYDRACGVSDWIGVVDVGDGAAVVLGAEPARTRVMDVAHGVLLVRWVHAPIGWQPGNAAALLTQTWERSASWAVASPVQVVQDAAFAGLDEDAERLLMDLPPGQYDLLTAEYRPGPEVRMVLHWIRPTELARDR